MCMSSSALSRRHTQRLNSMSTAHKSTDRQTPREVDKQSMPYTEPRERRSSERRARALLRRMCLVARRAPVYADSGHRQSTTPSILTVLVAYMRQPHTRARTRTHTAHTSHGTRTHTHTDTRRRRPHRRAALYCRHHLPARAGTPPPPLSPRPIKPPPRPTRPGPGLVASRRTPLQGLAASRPSRLPA